MKIARMAIPGPVRDCVAAPAPWRLPFGDGVPIMGES